LEGIFKDRCHFESKVTAVFFVRFEIASSVCGGTLRALSKPALKMELKGAGGFFTLRQLFGRLKASLVVFLTLEALRLGCIATCM